MNNMSTEIKDLCAALSKAQGMMRNASKDSLNPHFKSKYADLASVIDASREPLAVNGLSFVQVTGEDNLIPTITTYLMHESGQWISSFMKLPLPERYTSQQLGSSMSYARRYMLSAILGIAAEDDDGNSASGVNEKQQNRNKQRISIHDNYEFDNRIRVPEPSSQSYEEKPQIEKAPKEVIDDIKVKLSELKEICDTSPEKIEAIVKNSNGTIKSAEELNAVTSFSPGIISKNASFRMLNRLNEIISYSKEPALVITKESLSGDPF